MQCRVGESVPQQADLYIESDTGSRFYAAAPFEYLEQGQITKVFPSSGQYGTRVTLTGTHLLGVGGESLAHVSFMGITAFKILSVDHTQIVAVPDHANEASGFPNHLLPKTADVVLTSNTGAIVYKTNGFKYLPEGQMFAVFPNSGQLGTRVGISGVRLLGGGARIVKVTLAGVESDIFQESDTLSIVLAAASNATSGPVVLTADTGAVVQTNGINFDYVAPGVITSVVPNSGSFATVVTIKGKGIRAGGNKFVSITLAGIAAELMDEEADKLVVAAGAGPARVGDVVITMDTGAYVTLKNGFEYLEPGFIHRVTPSHGHEGTDVVIVGQYLLAGGNKLKSVTLAGVAAEITFQDQGKVTVVAAQSAAKTGDVTLTADTGGVVTRLFGWEYEAQAVIQQVAPSTGQYGTRVAVTGTNMLGGGQKIVSVTLDGVQVETIKPTLNQDETINVVVATGTQSSSAGAVVLVADSGATVSRSASFAYLRAGAVKSVKPAVGQGGTVVVISGTGLYGGGTKTISVLLGGSGAAIEAHSDTSIRVKAAISKRVDGGDVVLTSDSGAVVTALKAWSYAEPGLIKSLTPAYGQLNTKVTLIGERLLGGGSKVTKLTFGETTAEVLDINIDGSSVDSIVARVPGGAPRTWGVEIVSDTGALVAAVDVWTYQPNGKIVSVVPPVSHEGTTVTVRGTRLKCSGSNVTSVKLANVAAKIVSFSDDSVVVIAQASSAVNKGDVVITVDTEATVTSKGTLSYIEQSVVESVTPNVGQIGTRAAISGARMRTASDAVEHVFLGDAEASITSENDTLVQVVVTRAAKVGVATSVRLVGKSGSFVTKSSAWTHLEEGAIGSVSPASGQFGTRVVIKGARLLGGGTKLVQANMAGTNAKIIDASDSEINLITNTGAANKGAVTLTSDTGAIVSLGNAAYEQLADGVILSVSPPEGQLGTLVTIKGERLLGGGAKFHSVKLNGVAVLKFISGNSTQIIARADASDALGSGAVLLTSDSGAEVRVGSGWTYNAHSTVKTVEPATGQYGTKVLLSGTNLLGVTSGKEIVKVTLAGVEAKIVSGESQTEIAVVAQRPTEARKGDVHILADSGAYFTGAAFEYVEAAEVKLVEPTYGQIDTRVAITGSNLLAGGAKIVSVTLDGVAATVRNSSNTEVLVTVQHKELAVNQTTSTGNVVMTVDTGAIITAKDGWTYRLASAVQTITPAFGHGGTRVVIEGARLHGHGKKIVRVTLAGITAELKSISVGAVVVVAAPSLSSHRGSVIVVADSGATTTEGKRMGLWPSWSHQRCCTKLRAFWHQGRHHRGTSSRTQRTNCYCALGGVIGKIVGDTDGKVSLIAQHGPSTNTVGDVVITGLSGSLVTSSKAWTYMAAGVIQSVFPARGQHGTNVVVTGTNSVVVAPVL